MMVASLLACCTRLLTQQAVEDGHAELVWFEEQSAITDSLPANSTAG